MRKVIHIDMDCFFAAVEIRESPELRGKPVAVGGPDARGVLCTCSYEARAFGCRSAMPVFQALRLCPHLIILPVRSELYSQESRHIRSIFAGYTDLIEPLSLDEAFLDVTASGRYAWDIAKEIRARIFQERALTASAGIAPNKMLAKIASDWRKPNGQFAIPPEHIDAFLAPLPVRRIWGIGPKAEAFLEEKGVRTCGELQGVAMERLCAWFGRWGEELYGLCRGIDNRPVTPNRPRKSLATERTFAEDIPDLDGCLRELDRLYLDLVADLEKRSRRPIHKIFVKIKFSDFVRTSRECILATPDLDVYRRLLREAFVRGSRPVRLLGLGVRFVSDTKENPRQLELF